MACSTSLPIGRSLTDRPVERRIGNDRRGRIYRAFVLRTIAGGLRTTGAKVRVFGDIPPPGSVVAFHHNAPVDALVLGLAAWRRDHHPIAMVHGDIFRAPVVGNIVTNAGMVPVERGDREDRQAAFDHAVASVAAGQTMFIAPEQGISRSFTVHPIRHGATRVAFEADVPLVPAVSFGCQRFGGSHGQPFKPRRGIPIDIRFGDPIREDTVEATTAVLQTRLEQMLEQTIAEYPEDGTGKWWWPAHLGGTAPTVEQESERRRKKFGEDPSA